MKFALVPWLICIMLALVIMSLSETLTETEQTLETLQDRYDYLKYETRSCPGFFPPNVEIFE